MRLTLAAVFGFLLVSAPIHADVIFTNLSNPFTGTGGVVVAGSDFVGETRSYAAGFTPSSDYSMTEVQVFTAAAGPDPTFDAYLYSDSSGVPGSLVATLGTDLTAPPNAGRLNVIDLGTPIDLTSGAQFWLVLTPFDAGSVVAWEEGGPSNVPIAGSLNNGAFTTSTASFQFEIDGTPLSEAPEPVVSWLLAAAFCLGLIVFRKSRIHQLGHADRERQ